ncbi:MAG: NFACT family protein [Acidobacteriota bacterium]
MDQFLLQAVTAEVAGRLVEHEVLRVSYTGLHRYLLRFATPRRDNLLISVRPDLPRFHLLVGGGRAREARPDPFAARLDGELAGAVLTSATLQPWDRVVDLRFRLPRREDASSGRRLVVELLGRSANLLLLEPDGTIRAYARRLKSRFRTPACGATYRPPPGREMYSDIPLGPAALAMIRDRFDGPVEFLLPLSPLLADDLLYAAAGGPTAAEERLREILEAARGSAWSPRVYSTRPLRDFEEGDPVRSGDILVAAFPVRWFERGGGAAPARIGSAYASPSEAASVGLGLLERLRDFQAAREHHRALIRREIARLSRLQRKLEEEMERAHECERSRRMAEALLAGLSGAIARGGVATVPDPYDPSAGPLRVPIDPWVSLQANAERLFDRYKKGKRGVAMIGTRLAAVRGRLEEWRALRRPADEVRSPDHLDHLRERMGRLGLVHAPRSGRSEPRPRSGAATARVRRHATRDGFDILVGRSGDENDTLTFHVASPWDFWLHAAGHPGAHVVVRNPRRLKSMPESTLRAAAEIAAYYSGARGEGKVEVHFTQRRHVLKRKGMARGRVILRRHSTIRVTPRLPTSPLEDV